MLRGPLSINFNFVVITIIIFCIGFSKLQEEIPVGEDIKIGRMNKINLNIEERESSGDIFEKIHNDSKKFMNDSTDNHIGEIMFSFDEYDKFLNQAHSCIMEQNPEEKLCLKMEHKGDIVVVGDLHGSLEDALFIADEISRTPETTIFVFLGDYTDRGLNGPAVLATVLSMRCKYPERVILLRGNHEDVRLNRRYGFADQINEISEHLMDKIDDKIYQYLPQCLLINDIFFVHGGPPLYEFEPEIDLFNMDINYKPKKRSGLLWSDPRSNVTGTLPNGRGAGLYYGSDVLDEWCNVMGIREVFRGHEVIKGGFRNDYDNKNVCKHHTVFSSANKKGPGAYVLIHTDQLINGEYPYEVITIRDPNKEK